MSRQTTVKVTIYGAEYAFKTDDPEYILELAQYVDEQIRKIESSRKIISPPKLITLAAFNIADELWRVRQEKEEMSKKLSERLDAMLEMTAEANRLANAPDSS